MAYVKRLTIKATLYKALKYIVNPDKTNEKILISSNKCSQNEKVAIKEMRTLKKIHEKEDGIQGFHFIQSFKKGEVSEEEAHQIGKEWTAKFLDDNFQYILSTHTDRDHIHNHIVINSVGLNGKKYNSCVNEREDIRRYSDLVCLEHGLSIIERKGKVKYRSYKEWLESKNNTSWKDIVREDIDFIISSSGSFEEFIQKMKSEGYYIKHGSNVKYMTFKKSGMKKAVRGKTLGEDYSEEVIKERIKYKEFNISHLNTKSFRRYKISQRAFEYHVGKLIYKSEYVNTNVRLIILLFKSIFRNNQNNYEKNISSVKYTYAQKKIIAGIRDLTSSLNLLDKYNIKTRGDVKNTIQELEDRISAEDLILSKLNDLHVKSAAVMTEIELYQKYEKYYHEYNNSILKSAYRKKHEYEISKYESCKERLLKFGLKKSEFKSFKAKHENIIIRMEAVQEEKENIYQELYGINKLNSYLDHENRKQTCREVSLEKDSDSKSEKER
ncbi:relaxase/mobilization nuclease domain-containing protein [Sedimentibacter sp. MB35-C1]|uniref:relaxase/mobilization nuclease domain-containing protein n=1 Tax=Sedimentibacter sp. MB35-C1 TaxID=3070995 RepID=UPI0027DED5F4|nr:relaxase/mobilization nuclease domain-containing protein [Sedimentibacter sp. MB35-C1]WMJ77856.1 relaxase/mobilization nuclease domain-containing protein [Sedimentibacter sp. MB35-C1]